MLPKYTRVLLKLSGEALMGDKNFGFDNAVIAQYAADIQNDRGSWSSGGHRNWWR